VSARVVILGGGVAGLEALLALHDLAGERAQLTLVSREPDFLYKPLLVEEPLGLEPAERHELAPLAAELGADFVNQAAAAVDPARHLVTLADGSELPYDKLVVCLGGRYRPALAHAHTFPSTEEPLDLERMLAGDDAKRIAFVVPPGVTWSLPLYELALMAQTRARALGSDSELTLITPEDAPLAAFGVAASAAVAEMLAARGIAIEAGAHAREEEGGGRLLLSPGQRRLEFDEVVALPVMEGPALPGLPADASGFIPIDPHTRVVGVDDVYAAGDGTDFPLKQGGLGTQQADAAAEHIAHGLGAAVSPEPFRPVLRGKLLTGDESLHMRSEIGGGGGEGEASPDCLWWPPHKISGRYLAPFLYRSEVGEPEPPAGSLDVEVQLPKEWHAEPMAIDVDGSPRVD